MSKCKASTEVYSRVVGYFRPVQQWSPGKQEEFKDRVKFKLGAEAGWPRHTTRGDTPRRYRMLFLFRYYH